MQPQLMGWRLSKLLSLKHVFINCTAKMIHEPRANTFELSNEFMTGIDGFLNNPQQFVGYHYCCSFIDRFTES